MSYLADDCEVQEARDIDPWAIVEQYFCNLRAVSEIGKFE